MEDGGRKMGTSQGGQAVERRGQAGQAGGIGRTSRAGGIGRTSRTGGSVAGIGRRVIGIGGRVVGEDKS